MTSPPLFFFFFLHLALQTPDENSAEFPTNGHVRRPCGLQSYAVCASRTLKVVDHVDLDCPCKEQDDDQVGSKARNDGDSNGWVSWSARQKGPCGGQQGERGGPECGLEEHPEGVLPTQGEKPSLPCFYSPPRARTQLFSLDVTSRHHLVADIPFPFFSFPASKRACRPSQRARHAHALRRAETGLPICPKWQDV